MKMLSKRYLGMLVLAMCAFMAGCGGGHKSTNLELSIASGSVSAGSTAQLRAMRGDPGGTLVDVTNSVHWSSAQPSIATVDQTGLLTSLVSGTTSINASIDTASGSLTVAVGAPGIKTLVLSPANSSIPAGFKEQFTATATYANSSQGNASASVQWAVAPSSVASIDQNGLLSAKAPGTFTVTATSASTNAQITGSVTTATLSALTISPAGGSVQEGVTQQFTATATFSDSSTLNVNSSVTWSSSNISLLQISSSGLATAQTKVNPGTVTVFAQVGSQIASTQVHVVPTVVVGPALTALLVTPTASSVAMHTGQQLRATGYYADGSQQDISTSVTWSSNNPGVSSVDQTGMVLTGVPGASTIQAQIAAPSPSRRGLHGEAITTLQGQSVSLVTSATLLSLIADSAGSAVSPYNLPVASTQQLALSGIYSDGTKQDLTALATWQSLSPAVATVNAQGLALGVAKGSVQFTASFAGQSATTPPLQVSNAQLQNVTLTLPAQTLLLGIISPATLLGNYTDGSQQDLSAQATFQSSNPAVVTVVNGFLIGLSAGTSTITGTVQGQSATTPVAVAPVTLRSITITDNPQISQFAIGTTKRYRALGTFSDGGTTDVTTISVWGSTDPTVFTVDNGGVAHGGSVGSAAVTVSLLGVSQITGQVAVTPATLTGLVVSPGISTLGLQSQQQYTAVGTFSDGTTEDLRDDVKWASSDSTVLYLSSDGNATGVAAGSAQITASLQGQTASTSSLHVTAAKLTSTDLSPVNPTIALDTNEQLFLNGTYEDGSIQDLTNCAQWTTSAPNVVYVNNSGLINGTSPGTATITALCGADSVFTTVTVAAKTLTSVAISPSEAQIAVGGELPFELIGTFSDGSTQEIDENVQWLSSLGGVGTLAGKRAVVDGNAVGVSPGNSTITATYRGLIAPPAVLHVTAKPIGSVVVTPNAATIAYGSTQQFTAQATYTDGTGGDISGEVQWSSSNPSLISISAGGLATAQNTPGGGSATITALTGTFSASTTVQVQPNGGNVLTALTVVPTSSRIAVGTPQQLTAMGTFTDGTTRDVSSSVTWTSSNPSDATVSSTGLVTGVAPGTVTLQAQSGTLQSPTTLIVDTATLVSLAMSPSGATFASGTNQQFQLIGTFSDGSTQVLSIAANWQSSNPAAATVSSTGLAQGTGVGTAQISGTFDGQTATTSPVQVTQAALVSISVQPSSGNYAKGTTQQFRVTGSFADGTTEDLTSSTVWQSADPTVVSISSAGLGQGVGLGTTQVTGTVQGVSASSGSIKITPATLTSISITPANPRISQGTSQAFTAIGTFSDGTTEDLTNQVVWASANPSVATINQNGVAESGTTGSTQFSATYAGVTTTTGTIPVTPTTLTTLTVTPNSGTIAAGTTQQFTATGTFSDGTSKDLTSQVSWSSSNGAALAINSSGLATGTGGGTAQVTAIFDGQTTTTGNYQVTAATLTSVAITPASSTVPKGGTQQFTLTGTFSDGSTQDISGTSTWASSNPGVASVNGTGLANSIQQGSTSISGHSGSYSAAATFTVSAATPVSVVISPNTATFAKGTTQQFTATQTYSDGTTADLTYTINWSSSNTSVLSIDAHGLATGIGVGSGAVLAGSGAQAATTSTITVAPAALASVSISPSSPSTTVNGTKQFTATGTYTDGTTQNLTTQSTWSSSATNVATITTNGGLATGVSNGSTTIQAQDGSFTSSTTLSVAAAPVTVTGFVVTPSSASIAKGTHQQYVAAVQYSDGSTVDVTSQTTWQSSATTIATISSSGLATGMNGGNTQITGTYNGASQTVPLTVSAATLSSLAITPATASIANGTTEQFTATGTLSDGSTENLTNSATWTSTNTNDATINSTGLATGHAAGSTTITAQSGSTTSNSATLTITSATVSGISVQPSSISAAAGNTQQLLVTANFTDGTSQNVTQSSTYASSAPSIATVSSGGLVSTLAQGTSTVTVTLNANTATVPVAVSMASLQSIAITPSPLSLAAGSNQQLTATGTYSDGSTANVTNSVAWSSSASSVLTVSTTGLLTSSTAGNATVTAALNGASGTLLVTVTSAVARSISVTPSSATLAAGQTQQYTAIATLSDNSQQTVTTSVHWSVSDSTRASISNTSGSQGLLTSSGAGTVTVSASLGSGSGTVSGSATAIITSATLSSIAVSPAAFTLATGTTQQLTVTGTYSDSSNQDLTSTAIYTTNSSSTASVSNRGLVTGTAGVTGVATITATVGTTSGTATATVAPNTLLAIAVTPATTTIANGLTQQFTATGTYTGNQQNITSQVQWTSSNPAIATINAAGLATSVGPGTTTITASSGGQSGNTTLTVGSAALQSLTVTSLANSFANGTSLPLHAIGNYSDGSTQDLTNSVTWTSLNTAVGVVSQTGVASGVSPGVFGAQASLDGLSATKSITVTNAVLQSITLTPTNQIIVNLNPVQYTATGHFSDGTTQILTTGVHWSTTPAVLGVQVGTISQSGQLTAVAVGTGTVNASYGNVTGSTGFTVVSL